MSAPQLSYFNCSHRRCFHLMTFATYQLFLHKFLFFKFTASIFKSFFSSLDGILDPWITNIARERESACVHACVCKHAYVCVRLCVQECVCVWCWTERYCLYKRVCAPQLQGEAVQQKMFNALLRSSPVFAWITWHSLFKRGAPFSAESHPSWKRFFVQGICFEGKIFIAAFRFKNILSRVSLLSLESQLLPKRHHP